MWVWYFRLTKSIVICGSSKMEKKGEKVTTYLKRRDWDVRTNLQSTLTQKVYFFLKKQFLGNIKNKNA